MTGVLLKDGWVKPVRDIIIERLEEWPLTAEEREHVANVGGEAVRAVVGSDPAVRLRARLSAVAWVRVLGLEDLVLKLREGESDEAAAVSPEVSETGV